MVRQERREEARKDRTPYKCEGCEAVWVSSQALSNHKRTCVNYAQKILDKEVTLEYRHGGHGQTVRATTRLAPVAKELKIAMKRMLVASNGLNPLDCIMPKQGRMYVSPGMAQFWLQFNGNNVEPSYARVEEYAQEMAAGRWYDSRNPICFRDNGDLCSGQHRLLGHVYSNTGFEYNIELGITEEEEAVIDIGRKRTVANFLSRGGKIENHRIVAQAASILWGHDEFVIPFAGTRTYRSRPIAVQGVILPFVRSHPEIENAVRIVHNEHKSAARLLKGEGVAAALWMLMARSGQAGIDRKMREFWGLLSSGEMLQVGSPIYALREQLINAASNSKIKIDTLEVMAKTIKAFNDFTAGRRRKSLIWRKDEDFPRING